MSKKRSPQRLTPPKPGSTKAGKARPTQIYLQFALRGLGSRGWPASSDDVIRLSALLRRSGFGYEDWDDDMAQVTFFSFRSGYGTVVCLNLEYVQLLRVLEQPPAPPAEIFPSGRVRLHLDQQPLPLDLGAARPELLNFQALLERVENRDHCLSWLDEHGQVVVARVGEIVALEYPGVWGEDAAEEPEEELSDDPDLLNEDQIPF